MPNVERLNNTNVLTLPSRQYSTRVEIPELWIHLLTYYTYYTPFTLLYF